MLPKKIFGLVTVLVAISLTALLTGCPEPAVEDSLMPPEMLAEDEAPAVSAPSEFTWTEAPTIEMIPDGPIKGMINGEPFEAKTVRVKKDDESASLSIHNKEADRPTGIIMKDVGIQLRFTMPEGQPGEFVVAIEDEKDFSTEHVYYWYPQGEDKGPMSVNTSWGAALQITEWTLDGDPDDEKILGTIKGKVALVCNDEAKSFVAGTFEAPYYTW